MNSSEQKNGLESGGVSQPRRKRRKKKHLSFVALTRKTLTSPEWRTGLTPHEKILYIQLKSKFVGYNNGELMLAYSELKGMMAKKTITNSYRGLENKGWIKRTKVGGLFRYRNLYRLTGKFDNAIWERSEKEVKGSAIPEPEAPKLTFLEPSVKR